MPYSKYSNLLDTIGMTNKYMYNINSVLVKTLISFVTIEQGILKGLNSSLAYYTLILCTHTQSSDALINKFMEQPPFFSI